VKKQTEPFYGFSQVPQHISKSSTKLLDVAMWVEDAEEVRRRIQEIREPYQTGLKFQYLTGARVSEVCGKWALTTMDYSVEEFEGEEAILFVLKTAKRKGKRRAVALPLRRIYEPWSREVLEYLEALPPGPAFPWSTWTQWNYARRAFAGLEYQVDSYKHPRIKQLVQEHERELRTHGLRHIRARELIITYGFTSVQLATYMGWSLKDALGGSRMMDRYVSLQWRDYFPKLLRENPFTYPRVSG